MGKQARLKAERRRARAASPTGLHLTVVTGISDGLDDLATEVAQTKAALLYADRVTLFSPKAAMLAGLRALGDAGRVMQQLEFLASTAPFLMPSVTDNLSQLTSAVAGLTPLNQLSGRERLRARDERRRVMADLEERLASFADVTQGLWDAAGGGELLTAVDAGLLELDPVVTEVDVVTRHLVVTRLMERVSTLLADGTAYPMFDQSAGELARLGLADGVFVQSPAASRRAVDAGLATGLLDRLPNFGRATVAELLDIRDALDDPLTRYRAAIQSIGAASEVGALDPDFGPMVHETWVGTVAPALDEIREAVEVDASLKALASEIIRDPATHLGAAAVGVAGVIDVAIASPGVTAGLSLALTGTTGYARGRHAIAQRVREARGAPFYFLYDTNRRLRR